MERVSWSGYVMTPRDHEWLDEGVAWQFEMPPKAAPFWRLWGIRHARAAWKMLQAQILWNGRTWHDLWREEWVAYAIRRGWC